MKRNLSHICGFPVKMTSKALYATQELFRAPVRVPFFYKHINGMYFVHHMKWSLSYSEHSESIKLCFSQQTTINYVTFN